MMHFSRGPWAVWNKWMSERRHSPLGAATLGGVMRAALILKGHRFLH